MYGMFKLWGENVDVKEIKVMAQGYAHCRSAFYTVQDAFQDQEWEFYTGINRMYGEIDAGNWAVSYLLSMYQNKPRDFILSDVKFFVNEQTVSADAVMDVSCYMDISDPLFATKWSVKKLIQKQLRCSKIPFSFGDIVSLFELDECDFNRNIQQTGNRKIRIMAAVGCAAGKQIFCFPWMSAKRFRNFHYNMSFTLEVLERLNKVVVLPLS